MVEVNTAVAQGGSPTGQMQARGAYVLLLAASGAALLMLGQPRGVTPHGLPALRLQAEAVTKAIAEDRRLAQQVIDSPGAREADALFLQQGAAERQTAEPARPMLERRRTLRQVMRRLLDQEGEAVVMAMRAAAVERLEAALAMELDGELEGRVLGGFANLLDHNRATRDGVEIAPHFVLRVLYKCRWNLIFGLPADYLFSKTERLAYLGWVALHSGRLAPADQLTALMEYRNVGGAGVNEAMGIILYGVGDLVPAEQMLRAAYAANGSIRLRNFVRAAQLALESPSD